MMNGFDIFTSLPTSLSCCVLRDWLNLKSVVTLDSAYCCKANRVFFEDLLQSHEYFVRDLINYPSNDSEMYALPKFGNKIRLISFEDKLSVAQAQSVAEHCRKLTHVYFYEGPHCSPALLYDMLEKNQSIEFLNISLCRYWQRLGDHALSFAGLSFPKLRALALIGNYFENNCVVDAIQMSNCIVQLDLSGGTLTKYILREVQRLCPHLVSLGLGNTSVDTKWNDEVLGELTAICSHILHLNIGNALCYGEDRGITDAGILAVMQNLKGLQSLNISENYDLTDASLVHIYTHCANTLHTLYLDYDRDMMQEDNTFWAQALNTLLERCTHLRCLRFYDWHGNTALDVGVTLPPATLTNLTTLVLLGNVVCDRNLVAIRTYGYNLQQLGLISANTCFDSVCPSLLEASPRLVGLYLAGKLAIDLSMYKRDGLTIGRELPEHLASFNVLGK